ncbi:acyl-CoA thioesterase [Fodinisporobacter ferrooxydans]|uniref:Acyl-CoA thioesterase n=1 Tax=Fodinisporobacter ferrooxydans TaxID=2901836 RepID=A0ABY4CJK3_9BACL|nr:acyl-CoA thioesterase [Alicyclobacillaceae bacterium MYW30-H2]
MEPKVCKDSRVTQTILVFPNELNHYQTMFGGSLMAHIDMVATLSAIRHSRTTSVTASTDSVDFLCPITQNDSVCLESYVTWTGKSSMEVFVKVVAEDLFTGERRIATTSFLTFVALDKNKKPVQIPQVIPETEEEKKLHETALDRAKMRKLRKEESKNLASHLTTKKYWDN